MDSIRRTREERLLPCRRCHGAASDDPYRAGTTLARLRRLFDSPGAATVFAERYLGKTALASW
ncbi:hypothetical protein [Streptomyces sp. MN13]